MRGSVRLEWIENWVAIPVIGALFLGQWLDNKYQTGQVYFLTLTGVAFILSIIGMGKVAIKYLKKAEKADNKLNKENDTKQDGQ